ncbi:MAG TPA: CDP-alcohol phosphatidyltransferase family protein [candidate division Zixibacteria bacterium]|nr:CDP-alcohol phosphatidyltransferase family protein [candidate division Zixibacteria bacterium]
MRILAAMDLAANRRLWTIPNLLSLSRLALIPVWWWVMADPGIPDWWGGAIIVYGIISDVADGWIARRFDQISDWGKLLDPLGDKIAALAVAVFCVLHRDLPIVALAVTVGRDVVIVIGGWLVYRSRGQVPSSIDVGRYAALLWGLVLLLYAFEVQPYAAYALWPAVGLYCIAGIAYLLPVIRRRTAS